jgi:hypothetical protein
MKTNHEHLINRQDRERGNALVYVLIAIALFAALSFTLGRQKDENAGAGLSEDRAELYATQIIAYTAQSKSVIDQMLMSGSHINDLIFTLPTDATFSTGSPIHKVYHPEGGGLNPATLPAEAVASGITDPVPGWYLGRFNNIEWTGAGNDVVLVAYGLKGPVCEKLNESTGGGSPPPSMGDTIRNVMIDDSIHGGTNVALWTTDPAGTPICGDCHKRSSLCVQQGGIYAFYTIVADQ